MSTVITPEQFLKVYMEELQKADERARVNLTTWTEFTKGAAETVITKHALEPLAEEGLKASREYFRVDVVGSEKVGDKDCNWMLRVAFEHENSGWHRPDTQCGAPARRPYWIQELCKLTHLYADLHVLATYHNSQKKEELEQLLQSNVDRMQKEGKRMTRFGRWLFIFGREPHNLAGFRAFTLDKDDRPTIRELRVPS